MLLLFVVGIAAVIVVILIAVFLSVRLGRSEDHDEPMGRSSDRDRGRPDAGDPGWRDEPAPRRSPADAGGSSPGRQRPRPQAQDRRYRDGDGRRPERGQATRQGDYDYPQRRPGRYDSGPLEQPADARRPVTSGSRRPASGRDHSGRRSPDLHDTGPARHPAADDFPSEPLHAADFPSGEFPSRPQPAGFPSGEFPSASRSAADAPTVRYRMGGPHTDEFSAGPPPEEDFVSSEFPAADFPSGEMPAARTRSAPPKTGPGQDRSDSRRRPGKGQNAPKGRSRKRDNDDWPSMEWDKLTDEQYWAQLSSDKPLATTARSPQPAGEPRPAASSNGHARPGAGGPKPVPAAQPTAPYARPRDLADRKPASSQREAAAGRPAVSRREPEREMVSQGEEAVSRRAAAPQREAVTERLPVRPRQQTAAAAAPRNDAPVPLRPDATPTPPAGQPSLAMLTSLASGPNGALDDDPLTSPTFSRPTADSRSYRRSGAQAGAPARADDPSAAAGYGRGAHRMAGYGSNGHHSNGHRSNGYTNGDAPANGAAPGRAQVNRAYQVPGYADPGYAYAPAPPAAAPQPVAASQPAEATQPAGWTPCPRIRRRRGIRTAATWSRPPPPAIPPSRRWDTRTRRPTPGSLVIPATTAVTGSRPMMRLPPSGTPGRPATAPPVRHGRPAPPPIQLTPAGSPSPATTRRPTTPKTAATGTATPARLPTPTPTAPPPPGTSPATRRTATPPTNMGRTVTAVTQPARVDRSAWRGRRMSGPRHRAGETVDRPRDHARTYHLHRLAAALDTEGLQSTVKTTYPAALHVFTPGAAMLAESIDCTPGTDDSGRLRWYYRWSWGELLSDAEDPSAAAAKIAEVLSSR